MKKLSMEQLNRVSVSEFQDEAKFPLVLILDDIRSMNNVGSLFRTADAFAVEHLYLCGITAQPPHKEIHKTALGATESVSWSYEKSVVDLVKRLKEEQYMVYIVEQTDTPLYLNYFEPEKNKKIAIILGNEVFGVNDALLAIVDGALEIPQYGTKHSLNVTIAGGVVIWSLIQKMERQTV